MTNSDAPAAPAAPAAPTSPTSPTPLRRNLLRACYLLLVVGLGLTAWPRLVLGGAERPLMDGVVDAMLAGMQLLAIIGLFSPVRMLPVILFDIVWKALWVGIVALPLVVRGEVTPGVAETLFACAWVVPFLVIVPWGWVYRNLLRSSEPFRRDRASVTP
jgi:hypothetical protein